MSTSLLYHAFGIRGYVYSRTQYDNGQVIFTIHQEPEEYRCSACGSSRVISRGQVDRWFQSRRSAATPRSLYCPSRGSNVEPAGWCVRSRSRSPTRGGDMKSFERYAMELSRSMTIADVAHHLNVGWDLIKDIRKRNDTQLCQAQAQAFALHRHRRDCSRRGIPLPDGGHGPGERRDCLRGRR